jgi:hypothetical protein
MAALLLKTLYSDTLAFECANLKTNGRAPRRRVEGKQQTQGRGGVERHFGLAASGRHCGAGV